MKTKDELIQEHIQDNLKIGGTVLVERKHLNGYGTTQIPCTIMVDGATEFQVKSSEDNKIYHVRREDITFDTVRIGADPITPYREEFGRQIEQTGFTLGALRRWLLDDMERPDKCTGYEDIKELNFNPYVIINGEKKFYQRELVWTLEDEQSFIESLYMNLNCGMILFRERSDKFIDEKIESGDTENLGIMDVVDGKQRLNTIRRYFNNEFCDRHGNYYKDLSRFAQRQLDNSQAIHVAKLRSDSTDKDVLKAFLNVNFAGKPMSKEHICYVAKIATLYK